MKKQPFSEGKNELPVCFPPTLSFKLSAPAHLRVDTGKAGIFHVERLRRI